MGLFDFKYSMWDWFEKPIETPPTNVPAPPMSTVKPHKDISEPVIKLLEMLERDEWEFKHDKIRNSDYYHGGYCYDLINVFDESVNFTVEISLSYLKSELTLHVRSDWMTKDEIGEVDKAVAKRYEEFTRLYKAHSNNIQREELKRKICK